MTHVLSEKHLISFIKNLKIGRNFIARREFRRCIKEQKTRSHRNVFLFFYFYIVYFPNNVFFVMSYTERHSLILENLKTIELLSSFKVFL